MRVLVVINHYFKQQLGEKGAPLHGWQIEPLAKIAGLSAAIVEYYRLFGPVYGIRNRLCPPAPIVNTKAEGLDIVIIAMKNANLLPAIGVDPTYYSVEYVEGDPTRLEFHAQEILRDRMGGYDFYCVIEDDLITRDPDFFAKLAWFQEQFGPRRLLAATRYEMSSSRNLARLIFDSDLKQTRLSQFGRPGQLNTLAADWSGSSQTFELPSNPHAGSYFLTDEQLRYWVTQDSFMDGDSSWVGPMESAMTLSVGKVFDIYKSAVPDPLFLGLEHYGSYKARTKGGGWLTYGNPPLLEIARDAFNTLIRGWESGALDKPPEGSLLRNVLEASPFGNQEPAREAVDE